MAWKSVDKDEVLFQNGGTVLQAATTITAGADSTGVLLAEGRYKVVIDATAVCIDTSDEIYNILIQANTKEATSTWIDKGQLVLGDVAVTLVEQLVAKYVIPVHIKENNLVRISVKMAGTAESLTYSAKIYPDIL